MHIFKPHKVVSASLNKAGELEVVRQYPCGFVYGNGQPAPDKVTKEIYRCEGGKIVLAETVEGKHTPARMMNEQIEF